MSNFLSISSSGAYTVGAFSEPSVPEAGNYTISLTSVTLSGYYGGTLPALSSPSSFDLAVEACLVTSIAIPSSNSYNKNYTIADPLIVWSLNSSITTFTPNCGYLYTQLLSASNVPSFCNISSGTVL